MRKLNIIWLILLLSSCAPSDPNFKGVKVGECRKVTGKFSKISISGPSSSDFSLVMEDGYRVKIRTDLLVSGTVTYQICNSDPFGPTNTIISIETDNSQEKTE